MHKPATATITRELADDIYMRNSDGFGIMFAKDGILYTQKTLGKPQEIWDIINEHQGDELLLHWRMRTHGDVDLTNCHPYEVYGDGSTMPVSLMHNGVLSTGNAADMSKSDTWHYIRDFVIPTTQHNPAMLFATPMRDMMASHIGTNNKFAMMNHLGEVSICNRKSGIEWSGLWFSNTYAWSVHKFGAVKQVSTYTYPKYDSAFDYEYKPSWTAKTSPSIAAKNAQVATQQAKNNKGKAKGKRTVKPVAVTTPAKTTPARDLSEILVNDVRDLLLDERFYSVEKRITNDKLAKVIDHVGFSDVVDLINMAVFNEIDDATLSDCLTDVSLALTALYGESSKYTSDQLIKMAHDDNKLQAEALGYTAADLGYDDQDDAPFAFTAS